MHPYSSANTILYESSFGASRKMQGRTSTAAGLQSNAMRGISRSSINKPSSIYKNDSFRGKRRTVVFSHVSIRLYERTLGNNPCCEGAPLTFGGKYTQKQPDYIEDYENLRKVQRRRTRKELIIPYELRRLILHSAGVTEDDVIRRESELFGIRTSMIINRSNYSGFKNRLPTSGNDNRNDPNSAVLPRIISRHSTSTKQAPTPLRNNTPMRQAPIRHNTSSTRQVRPVSHTIQPAVRQVRQSNEFQMKEVEVEC